MSAAPATFFTVASDKIPRVHAWMRMYHRETGPFWASFLNWANVAADRVTNDTAGVTEVERGITSSLKANPIRIEVMLRNLMWFLSDVYRDGRPKEGLVPLPAADRK